MPPSSFSAPLQLHPLPAPIMRTRPPFRTAVQMSEGSAAEPTHAVLIRTRNKRTTRTVLDGMNEQRDGQRECQSLANSRATPLTSDNQSEQAEDRTEHLNHQNLDEQLCTSATDDISTSPLCSLDCLHLGSTHEDQPHPPAPRWSPRCPPPLHTAGCTRPSSGRPRTARSRCSSWPRCRASPARRTGPAWTRRRWLRGRGEGAGQHGLKRLGGRGGWLGPYIR